MSRLERLEAALVHMTDVLVLQSERMDVGFRTLREELQADREETRGLREETRQMREESRQLREDTRQMREDTRQMREDTRQMREETRQLRETVADRLDRLIAITLKERTAGIERLASIEQRLAKLEDHVGL